MNFLKFLMLLTLSLWLGGIIFFTAVEAPLILHYVHDRTLGGEIINGSLAELHWLAAPPIGRRISGVADLPVLEALSRSLR